MKEMFYNSVVILFTGFAICDDVSAGTGMACATERTYFTSLESRHCSADKFCCENDDGTFYCCDASDYFVKNGMKTVSAFLIAAAVALLLVCCLCCFCCPCCLLYKRRHQGTVYGNIPQPGMQTTIVTVPSQPYPVQHNVAASAIPPCMPMPQPGMPMPQPGMPIPQHGMPMPQPGMPQQPYQGTYPVFPAHAAAQGPPSYNEAVAQEAYSKQSPYNPNF